MHQVAQVLELQHHIYPVKVKVAQLCPTLFDLMDYMVHGILQARMLEWGVFPFSRGSSQPRDQTQASLADSLLAEPQGKPKSTGVDSLSLLQGIFLTQDSICGVLHCRRILYQLSYHISYYVKCYISDDILYPVILVWYYFSASFLSM